MEELSIQRTMQNLHTLVLRIREKMRQVLEGTRACEVFDACCGLVEENNLLKLLLIVMVVNSILPALAFFLFAILTLTTTFTGFLLLEGALLFWGACAAVLWFGLIGILFILTAITTTLLCLLYKRLGFMAYNIERFYSSHASESTDDDLVVVEEEHEE